MSRAEIQQVYLRHRGHDGILDLEAVIAERRALAASSVPAPQPFAELIHVRRMQAWPEYLIEKAVREMAARETANG